MTSFDYARMKTTATRLLTRFDQGVVVLERGGDPLVDPGQPWVVTPGPVTPYDLQAVVRQVEQRYVDGNLIIASDDQILFAAPEGITPAVTDTFSIDGQPRILKSLRKIPGAGLDLAWVAIVGGPR